MIKIANPLQNMTAQIGGAKLCALLAAFAFSSVLAMLGVAEAVGLFAFGSYVWELIPAAAAGIFLGLFLPFCVAGKILRINASLRNYAVLTGIVLVVVMILGAVADAGLRFAGYFFAGGEKTDNEVFHDILVLAVSVIVHYAAARAFSMQILKINKQDAAGMAAFSAAVSVLIHAVFFLALLVFYA